MPNTAKFIHKHIQGNQLVTTKEGAILMEVSEKRAAIQEKEVPKEKWPKHDLRTFTSSDDW